LYPIPLYIDWYNKICSIQFNLYGDPKSCARNIQLLALNELYLSSLSVTFSQRATISQLRHSTQYFLTWALLSARYINTNSASSCNAQTPYSCILLAYRSRLNTNLHSQKFSLATVAFRPSYYTQYIHPWCINISTSSLQRCSHALPLESESRSSRKLFVVRRIFFLRIELYLRSRSWKALTKISKYFVRRENTSILKNFCEKGHWSLRNLRKQNLQQSTRWYWFFSIQKALTNVFAHVLLNKLSKLPYKSPSCVRVIFPWPSPDIFNLYLNRVKPIVAYFYLCIFVISCGNWKWEKTRWIWIIFKTNTIFLFSCSVSYRLGCKYLKININSITIFIAVVIVLLWSGNNEFSDGHDPKVCHRPVFCQQDQRWSEIWISHNGGYEILALHVLNFLAIWIFMMCEEYCTKLNAICMHIRCKKKRCLFFVPVFISLFWSCKWDAPAPRRIDASGRSKATTVNVC
jgi:hypothetical protein